MLYFYFLQKEIDLMIEEKNSTWSGMVEDYNSVDKFKSEVVDILNEYENTWSSLHSNYKPFTSFGHPYSTNENLDSLDDLHIQEERQIADQYPFSLLISSP